MAAEQQLLVFSGVTDFTPNTASGRKREVTLTFDGNSTSPVDLDTNALSALQAAAEGLAGIGAGNVTLAATTSSGFFAIQVDYHESLGDVPQMTASMDVGFVEGDWSVVLTTSPQVYQPESPGQALIYTITTVTDDTTSDTLGGWATNSSGLISAYSAPSGFTVSSGGMGYDYIQFTETNSPPQGLSVFQSAGSGGVTTNQEGIPYSPETPEINQVTTVTMPQNPTPQDGLWRPDTLGSATDIYSTDQNATVGGACAGGPSCVTSGVGSHGSPYIHTLTYSGGSFYDLVVPAPTSGPSAAYATIAATASTTQQGGGGGNKTFRHYYARMAG